jgi:PAS domain S-box-containing protein
VEPDTRADEIKLLQRCIGDLTSVLALPAVWSGRGSARVATTSVEALVRVLRLDFAYLRIGDPVEGSGTEWARQPESCKQVNPQDIGRALEPYLQSEPPTADLVIPNPVGEGVVSIASFRLGIGDARNTLVAGSRRSDFPTRIERIILQAAANQAAVGLQESRYTTEQRWVAEELENRVAQRTAELTVVNEALKNEVIERTRAEARVRQDKRELRLLVDLVPQLIGALAPDGTVLHMNQTALAYLGMAPDESCGCTVPGGMVFHPEDLGAIRVSIRRTLSEGTGHEQEARVRRHDGEYRWFRMRYEPLHDEQGRVLRLYVSGSDIDDGTEPASALIEEEAEWSTPMRRR